MEIRSYYGAYTAPAERSGAESNGVFEDFVLFQSETHTVTPEFDNQFFFSAGALPTIWIIIYTVEAKGVKKRLAVINRRDGLLPFLCSQLLSAQEGGKLLRRMEQGESIHI